jgi:hypothetical protein
MASELHLSRTMAHPATQRQSIFQFHEVALSVRFIQGYRFLDRCGEALVRLEEVLDKEWIPAEATPKGGAIKNDAVAATASFNSDSLLIQGFEFFDLSWFRDQASKIYSVIREAFRIDRINVPTLRIVLQKGFEDVDVDGASQYLAAMNLCTPSETVLRMAGGKNEALEFVLITKTNLAWEGEQVRQRRRIAASVVQQVKTAWF